MQETAVPGGCIAAGGDTWQRECRYGPVLQWVTYRFSAVLGVAGVWLMTSVALRVPALVMPAVMFAFIALPYGGSVLVLADVQLDHQPAQSFQTQLLRK